MTEAVLLGLLLGLRHAADPDHVAAVSAIAARHRRRATALRLGLLWGLGHGAAVVAAGGALIAAGLAMPERLALGLEGAVGVVLVALGVANLRRARRGSAPAAGDDGLRSLGVGALHGLAGTAALTLLALAAMPGPAEAVAYLAVFAAGSIAGMGAVSLGLGAPLAWLAARPGGERAVALASGAVALAVGGWVMWHVGRGGGLL